MTARQLEEFRTLRDTIRERGTARIWVFLAGLVAWGALTIATAALASLPVATFLPLLVLAATFEAVFSLHVGVERVGRYLQVFLEDADEPGWEHVIMEAGPPLRGTRADPLFAVHFLIATLLNFVPVLLAGPVPLELFVVGSAHVLVGVRILFARRAASHQRAADLARFVEVKAERAKRAGAAGG
jgi:hypothetical protein